MKNSDTDLGSIVNASGFMLQIAVENAVESAKSRHGFELEAHEHPWRSSDDSGFIDLILGRSTIRLVCECKRSRDGNWIFAVEDSANHEARARLLWTKHLGHILLDGWFNFALTTESPQSAFCMIRGGGENDTPLLERISSKLIASVEALAREEAAIRTTTDERDNLRVYVPVIITTARLWMCRYDPAMIDLQTGVLSDGSFEEIASVRFRKAFTAAPSYAQGEPDEMPYRAFRRISREQERTIVVVNAGSFIPLLESWRNGVVHDGSGLPREWEMKR